MPSAHSSSSPSRTAARRRRNAAAGRMRPAVQSDAVPLPREHRWTFLTNHLHVLLVLARDPSQVLREVARQVGITERAVQRIIADLEEEGFIERERVGRQNRYVLNTRQALRHHLEAHHTIGELLALIDSK